MQRSMLTGQRLVVLFLAGCQLFNYPLLSLFNSPTTLFGIPMLFIYIFVAWAGVIGLMAWIIEHRGD